MSTSTSNDGTGQVTHDTKWGLIWATVTTAVAGAAIDVLSNVDWSAWPAWVGMIGTPLAAIAVGWLTAKRLPRFKS